MNDCKIKVVKMIDKALEVNARTFGCTCAYNEPLGHLCPYCTVRDTLRTARVCIVENVDRLEGIEKRMFKIQEDVVLDLKALLAYLN
jgi:hypothetical protein